MNTDGSQIVDGKCPVCCGKSAQLLYSIDSGEAAQNFVLREVDLDRHLKLKHCIENLWRAPRCDILCCCTCKFGYAQPYIAGNYEFYSLAYQMRRGGYPQTKWEFTMSIREIEKYKKSGGYDSAKLLEIGAGDGAFVRQVAPRLIEKPNIFCTEFSDYGYARISEYGIKCIKDDIRNIDAATFPFKFNFVCMFQVLEHLDCIHELFDRLFEITTPDASIFIGVPNEFLIKWSEAHGLQLESPPTHVGRWTRESFDCLSSRYGLDVRRYEVQKPTFMGRCWQIAFYRYLRKSQDALSFANRIERVASSSRGVRRVLRVICGVFYALMMLPELSNACAQNLGNAQWVELKRK
jgi:SAM-dependent methyltransferase